MGRAVQCMAEIRRLKPEKSLARLVRLVHEVYKNEYWRRGRFKNFGDWGKKTLGTKQGMTYVYVMIAEHLSKLSDKTINELRVNKCRQLARLAARDKFIDSMWIEKAKSMSATSLQRAVDRELLKDRQPEEFGELLDPSFRGLVHAPVNEQGVVYLFGMLSRELGFIVEKVQHTYPDCIAKRKVGENPEKWRQVRIEFEYVSSNFNHPPEGSDLIVCWEDDLKRLRRKAPLPVLELKSEIRKLRKT